MPLLHYDIVSYRQTMKTLQLTPPLLIIVMGYPGSGKTFFSRQFSDEYKLPIISEDRIRYELFEKPAFSKEEDEIIVRMQLAQLEEIMKTGSSLIFEGSSASYKERRTVTSIAHKAGYRCLVVWLQTDIATSSQRAAHRDKRNLDSKYSFNIDIATFERLKDSLDRPNEREESVVISGKHAYKSQSLTVLRKITSLYSEALIKNARSAPSSPQQRQTPRMVQ